MGGRSTVDELPAPILEAVQQALRDGANIDQIVERIHELGAVVSRSAVGRYTKRARDAVKRQQEGERIATIWVREIGEQPEGRTGRLAIEMLRTMAMHSAMGLGERDEDIDPEEIAALALALRRIEAAGKISTDRELAIRHEAKREAVEAAGKAAANAGLSADATAAIRAAIEGQTESTA